MRFPAPKEIDKALIKYHIESTLHSKKRKRGDQWKVISIGYFKRTGSAYVYLVRQNRLSVLRLSNHASWVRDADFASIVHRWVFEPGYLIKSIRHNNIASELADKSIEITFPFMALLAAIEQRNQSKAVFYLRYDELTVRHPLRRIIDETLIADVQKMVSLGLVTLEDNGALKTSTYGRVLVQHYRDFASDGWLHEIQYRDVDNLLTHIQSYRNHRILKKFKEPSVDVDPFMEFTPKKWRNLGLRAAQAYCQYPYQLVHAELPARRRSIYLYYYDFLSTRLITVRVGTSEVERTPIEQFGHVNNNLVTTTKSGRNLVRTIKRMDLSYLKRTYLHYQDLIYLRLIEWGVSRHSYLAQSIDSDSLVFHRWHNGHRYEEQIMLPVNAAELFHSLCAKGLIYLKNDKPHPTPFGLALLEQYNQIVKYTSRMWNPNLNGLGISDIIAELEKIYRLIEKAKQN